MSAKMIRETETIPDPEAISLAGALAQIEALKDDGLYVVKFIDDDGKVLRRFRLSGLEAWLAAIPLDEKGERDRSRNQIVCAIAVPGLANPEERQGIEATLLAELEEALSTPSA